ncbi:hypothetical protein, partial [Mycoplana dimorpha]
AWHALFLAGDKTLLSLASRTSNLNPPRHSTLWHNSPEVEFGRLHNAIVAGETCSVHPSFNRSGGRFIQLICRRDRILRKRLTAWKTRTTIIVFLIMTFSINRSLEFKMTIGFTPDDYGINEPRNWKAARIFDDLVNGVTSPFATAESIDQLYGNGHSAWRDFRYAVRAYTTLNGTFVLVDDDHQCIVETINIDECDGEDVTTLHQHFARDATGRYIKRLSEQAPDVESVRLTMYRLPAADYTKKPWRYFWENGEYLGEQRIPLVVAAPKPR